MELAVIQGDADTGDCEVTLDDVMYYMGLETTVPREDGRALPRCLRAASFVCPIRWSRSDARSRSDSGRLDPRILGKQVVMKMQHEKLIHTLTDLTVDTCWQPHYRFNCDSR